jgi:hypothetical protein
MSILLQYLRVCPLGNSRKSNLCSHGPRNPAGCRNIIIFHIQLLSGPIFLGLGCSWGKVFGPRGTLSRDWKHQHRHGPPDPSASNLHVERSDNSKASKDVSHSDHLSWRNVSHLLTSFEAWLIVSTTEPA